MTDTHSPASDCTVSPQHPWAELMPDRTRLLRLAPLPTEREGGARPLRFVEFSQVERHSAEQSLLRLIIEIPGQIRPRQQNVLEVWADHRSRELRFGPDSGLQVVPGNRGLGRFLLAQGAAWAQKRWGHYLIEGGALPARVASENERQRRDHCLRSQGLDIDYAPAPGAAPRYGAPRASALRSDWNRDKVQILEMLDAAAMLEQADRDLLAQNQQLRELHERISRLRREDGALRFSIVCLVSLALFQAGLLIWMATR